MPKFRPFVLFVPNEEREADLDLGDDVEVVVWNMTNAAPRDRFDIVVLPYADISEVLPRLAGLEVSLVQGQQIGYDNVIAHLPEGLRFANGARVHESSTAELAVAPPSPRSGVFRSSSRRRTIGVGLR